MTSLSHFLFNESGSRRRDLMVLTIFFTVVFLQLLGHFPLIDPDEGRYAEIPREMLERGDLITPMLYYVKYFEKPVLLYWLNAISFTMLGQTEFAARLACALSGLGTVLVTYHFGRELFDRRTGLLAAIILGTSTGFLIQSRMILTDIPLTFTLVTALGCYILAALDPGPRKARYYYLFYIFAGLAVLAKGLIGIVLPGAIIFWHIVLTRRWRLLLEMRLITGTLLFLAVTAPWFILVCRNNPEFFQFFFIHEHFERFLTKAHGRYQPLWFFLPVLLVGLLPWSLLIPAALRGWWRDRALPTGEGKLYLVLWAGLIFLFFSKSNSKLIPYILPVFPPLAILLGNRLSRMFASNADDRNRTLIATGVLLALIGCAGILYPLVAPKPEVGPVAGIVIGGLFLLQGIMFFLFARPTQLRQLIISATVCSLAIYLIAPHFIFPRITERKAYKEFGTIVRQQAGPDALLVSQGVMQGLLFYSQRRAALFGGEGELQFGSRIGDQSAWFFDEPRFYELWNGPRPVFAVIYHDTLDRLTKVAANTPRILGKNSKKVLITNR